MTDQSLIFSFEARKVLIYLTTLHFPVKMAQEIKKKIFDSLPKENLIFVMLIDTYVINHIL